MGRGLIMIDAIITPIVTSIPLLLLILVALIFVKSAVKIVPQGNADSGTLW